MSSSEFDSQLKEQFDADGFVVLPAFLNKYELVELEANLARVVREVVPAMPREHVFYEDKNRPETLKQLQVLHTHDEYFRGLFLGSRFERLAQWLLDDRVVGQNFQYFSKPPGASQATPPHQDGYYFKLTPCEALTMWLALDEVDAENGNVRYIRGSHKQGMREHRQTGVLGFSQGMTDFGRPGDAANEVSAPARPGDLLVHHALTIHLADANRSAERRRRSLGFIYFAASSRRDDAALDAYQRTLKEQLTASGKI